jgi:hypothetical protein
MNTMISIPINIDFELLREQKLALVEASQDNDKLVGLIMLLDYLQDEAVKAGLPIPLVYGEDDNEN